MFGDKRKPRTPRINTLVGRETTVTGDVNFEGGLHVDGRVKGSVNAGDETGSVFVLSAHGVIEGEVRVPVVIVDGSIKGDVHASQRVELAPNARVNGNVYYHLLEMSAGAEINGKLVHQPGGPRLLELHKSGKRGSKQDKQGDGGEQEADAG